MEDSPTFEYLVSSVEKTVNEKIYAGDLTKKSIINI